MSAPDTTANPDVSEKGAAGVRMRGVDKAFGANKVLSELDLDVAPGERVVIVGPSGSGKSTARCDRTSGWCSSTSTCSRT